MARFRDLLTANNPGGLVPRGVAHYRCANIHDAFFRANNIRKLFNLGKDDDVRPFVTRRQVAGGSGKPKTKAPKIQRLITATRLQRKRRYQGQVEKRRHDAQARKAQYKIMMEDYAKGKKTAQSKA